MNHLLTVAFTVILSALAVAQEIPGVRLSLSAPSIVPADGNVNLRLVIQVLEDVELSPQFLTGSNLTVRMDGVPREGIVDAGKGGKVALAKGTRIDRLLSIPTSRFVGEEKGGEVSMCAVGWKDMVGVDCTFKVAPDTSGMRAADLDLNKTEVILMTNLGDIQVAFRPDKAPKHVENFVQLCLDGFYDGTKFHRVIRNFMAQGGCPFTKDETQRERWGTGSGDRVLKLEASDMRHLRGTLSMAHAPTDPDTGSSGFFIVHKDSPHLDSLYSAFGNVVKGMDTLDRICNVRVAGQALYRPVQPVILQAAIVLPKKKK